MSESTMSLAALQALPIHPAAAAFPYISDDELLALADDIEANGLIHPIVLIDGEILDGRNRIAALAKTKVTTVPVTEFPGGDPVQYVISLNVHRRHLDTYQWAEAAKNLAPLFAVPSGTRTDLASGEAGSRPQGFTADLVAGQLHGAVSGATLERAWALMDRAPEAWAEAKRTNTGIRTAFNAAFSAPKPKPEPKPEYGVTTGADTGWAEEQRYSYDEQRVTALAVLIRQAAQMGEKISRYAVVDGDVVDSPELPADFGPVARQLADLFGDVAAALGA